MKQRRSLLLLLALVALVGAAWLSIVIATPAQRSLDQRVYEVASQLKCPVCQNESAADSSAAVAEQMRLVIRQQLESGKSEQQVLQYFAAHYGNQILLTPPQQGFNLLAWLMPVAMLLIGLSLLGLIARSWRAQSLLQPAQGEDVTSEELVDDPELRAKLEKELADDDELFG